MRSKWKPIFFSITKSFVQPKELTIIAKPADKESNNLFGELVSSIWKCSNVTKEISAAKYADEITQLIGRFDTIANIGHLRRVVTTVEEESAESISKKIEKETGEKTGGKLNNFFSSGNKKGASNGFWGVVSKFLGLGVVNFGLAYYFIKGEVKTLIWDQS